MSNSLVQGSSFLLGSEQSIESLAQKESARLLAVSDSHANAAALAFAIEKFGLTSDALVFCGDGVSDLAYLLQKASCDEIFFACIPPVVAFVRGNNDLGSYTFMSKNKAKEKATQKLVQIKVPLKAEFVAAGHRVSILHGHTLALYEGRAGLEKEAQNADILFFGHTHIPSAGVFWGSEKKSFVVNPGSCSIPRACQPPSFAVLDLKKGSGEKDISSLVDCTFYEIKYPEPKPFLAPPLTVG